MKKPKERQEYEKITQLISPGSKLLRTWPLPGGISAEMTVLEYEDHEGRAGRMILRQPGPAAVQQRPEAAKNEYLLLQALHPRGIPAPPPLALISTVKSPYLILEYIEGKPEFAPTDIPKFTYQFAAHLAKIHTISRSDLNLTFLPDISSEMVERMGTRPAQIEIRLKESQIRETLETAWPPLRRNPDVLLHGDYWPGNILWREDELVAVIDWEDACWGDPLYDLAVARLDLLWILGLEAMTSFTDYYQSNHPIDITGLPYWDLYAALRFIRLTQGKLSEWAAFFHPYGRRDIQGDTIREYYQFFISQAFIRLGLEI